MPLRKPNIPRKLHNNEPEIVGFLQSLVNYSNSLTQPGSSVKWGSTVLPNDTYLFKSGQTVNKSAYPLLWEYAANDATYTRTATTVTLPNDPGFVVKAK